MEDEVGGRRESNGSMQEVLKRVLACAERACQEGTAEEALECVTGAVKGLLGARSAAVVLLDHESDTLEIASAQGLSKQFMRTYRRGVGTGMIGEVMWNDRKVLVESAEPGEGQQDLKMELEFKSAICVRAATGGRPIGFLWADSGEPGQFKGEDLVTMRLLAAIAALAVERERTQGSERLVGWTTAKGAGGTNTYSYFHRRLTEEIERAQRLNERTTLLLVGLDGTTDAAGRVRGKGDEKTFGEVYSRVKGMMRSIDVMGRYGASQLVLYLPETGQEAGLKVAERTRAMVEHMREEGQEKGSGPTVSIGVAGLPEHGETAEQLMNALTSALFKAQRAGGNRVSGPAEMYVL